jgi:hypothetical protein
MKWNEMKWNRIWNANVVYRTEVYRISIYFVLIMMMKGVEKEKKYRYLWFVNLYISWLTKKKCIRWDAEEVVSLLFFIIETTSGRKYNQRKTYVNKKEM